MKFSLQAYLCMALHSALLQELTPVQMKAVKDIQFNCHSLSVGFFGFTNLFLAVSIIKFSFNLLIFSCDIY